MYKLGTIGILGIVALWSFHALPDDKKNVEQKASIDSGLITATDQPEVSISPSLLPTPRPVSSPNPTLTPSSIFSTTNPAPQIIHTATSVYTPTSTPSAIPTFSSNIPTASPTPQEQSAQPQTTPVPTSILTPTPTLAPTPTPTPAQSACLIKGNISSSGDKIYHMSGCASYNRTEINEDDGERWFCSEEEAIAAGWRKAQNCPQ